jgi:hypothetical protein
MLAGCSDIIGSDDDNFSFISNVVPYDSTMVDEAAAASLLGNLQIDGLMLLPHACFQLGGDYRRTAGDIIFTASATAMGSTCSQPQTTAMQYRVQAFGIARGIYRVKVYHLITGGQLRLISESTVSVN